MGENRVWSWSNLPRWNDRGIQGWKKDITLVSYGFLPNPPGLHRKQHHQLPHSTKTLYPVIASFFPEFAPLNWLQVQPKARMFIFGVVPPSLVTTYFPPTWPNPANQLVHQFWSSCLARFGWTLAYSTFWTPSSILSVHAVEMFFLVVSWSWGNHYP